MVRSKAGRSLVCMVCFLATAGFAATAQVAFPAATCSGFDALAPGCKHRKLLLIELTTGDIETTLTFKDSEDVSRGDRLLDARLGTSASRSKYSTKTSVRSSKDNDKEDNSIGLLSSAATQGLFSDFWSPSDSSNRVDRVIGIASSPESCPPPDKARTFCDNPVTVRNQLLATCTKLRSESACCELIQDIRAGSGWGEFQACTCSPQTVCDLEPFVDVGYVFSSCGVALHGLPGC